ncbi:MAG: PaaI family thioesterase [Chloroflexi bacterium]|nr:PaaI family thioesterase [Chloroflexota bacterium]
MTETDPRLEGYTLWQGEDPFEDHCGPLYYRRDEDGRYRCAMIVEKQHTNSQGGLHGGMMMTFADFATIFIARPPLDTIRGVTISFKSEFVSVGQLGEFLEAEGEVTHETNSLLFVRGKIFAGDRLILNFSSVFKKLGPRE